MLADLGGLLRLVQESLCKACKPPYLPLSSTTYHETYCSQLDTCAPADHSQQQPCQPCGQQLTP